MPWTGDALHATDVSPLANTIESGPRDRLLIPAVLARGDSVGRYLVIGQLGAGAMGVVYAAYDQKLDRRVALKALHLDGSSQRDSAGQTRLVQEAQAMARLSHPNVVTVYDVLVDGDRALVAMELVEGESLRAWLASERRTRSQILGAFLQAGHGLAAAHAARIVHRDFKPENVLIGRDGRVRVSDFGLALTAPTVPPPPGSEGSLANVVLSERVGTATTVAALAGSPAYMAPEQLRGASANERSDQFSFCVALYEALHGIPPFEGNTLIDLAESIEKQRFKTASTKGSVPRQVRAALARGLRPRPEDRFGSIDELLTALEADPRAKSRRWILSAAGVACAIAVVASVVHTRRADRLACADVGNRIDTVWSDAAQQGIHGAFAATGLPYAEDTFARTAKVLESYAGDWRKEATATCDRARRANDPLAAARATCLDQRFTELRAFADVLGRADTTTVNHAVGGARALVALDVCNGHDPLRGQTWPSDPTVRDQAESLTGQMAIVEALRTAGRYHEALDLAEKNAREAERIGFEPLVASALTRLSVAQRYAGRVQESEKTSKRSLLAAERSGAAREAITSWTGLAGRASEHRDLPLAIEALDHAEAWLARVPDDDALRARVWLDRALILTDGSKYDEARPFAEKARVAYEKAGDPEMTEAWNALGIDADLTGHYDEARVWYQRVLDARLKMLGPDHPEIAAQLSNMGEMLNDQGKFDEAIVDLKQALAICQRGVGPDHPATIETETALAIAYVAAGRSAEALPLAEHAVESARKAFAPGSRDELVALGPLCGAFLGLHRPAEAIEPATRELEMRSADGEVSDIVDAKVDLGLALTLSGRDPERGRALLREAHDALAKDATSKRIASIDEALAFKGK